MEAPDHTAFFLNWERTTQDHDQIVIARVVPTSAPTMRWNDYASISLGHGTPTPQTKTRPIDVNGLKQAKLHRQMTC